MFAICVRSRHLSFLCTRRLLCGDVLLWSGLVRAPNLARRFFSLARSGAGRTRHRTSRFWFCAHSAVSKCFHSVPNTKCCYYIRRPTYNQQPSTKPSTTNIQQHGRCPRPTTSNNQQPTTTNNQQPTTIDHRPSTNNQQYPTSAVQKPTSNIQHPTSNNQQPTTNIQQPISNIQHPTSNNQQPTTNSRIYISYLFDRFR